MGLKITSNGLLFTPNAMVNDFSGVLDLFIYGVSKLTCDFFFSHKGRIYKRSLCWLIKYCNFVLPYRDSSVEVSLFYIHVLSY